jgi:hypothetical protein
MPKRLPCRLPLPPVVCSGAQLVFTGRRFVHGYVLVCSCLMNNHVLAMCCGWPPAVFAYGRQFGVRVFLRRISPHASPQYILGIVVC